jgi:DNA invertase Pin-like site-specific DNA recombinase
MDNKAVLYCRLSKEDQDKLNEGDDSASIRNQRLLLTDYALEQGFTIVDNYQDDDYSGLFNDRPAFERLIEDAKLQKFNIVIAKSQSRFTRNMEHMEKYLHNDFPLLGIRFIGVVDHADTLNKGNKKSRQINGLVNEWYSEDLSENIRSVFENKMKQGQFLGSSCPYGYVKDPKNHNHLVIDEYASDIVKRIFNLYISGYGKAKIGSILSSEGVAIPSIYKTSILGQKYHNANAKENTSLWSYQTIHQIINNETYIGSTVQNKCKTLSYKSKKKKAVPKNEWIRVENTHEAIIDSDTWQMTQEIGKRKTKMVNADNKLGLFSGQIFCLDCGKSVVRQYNKKGENTGYCCKTYKAHGNRFCSSHFVSVEDLEYSVLMKIKEEANKAHNQKKIDLIDEKELEPTKRKDVLTVIKNYENQLVSIDKYKKKTYEDYVDGILTKEEYLSYKNDYSNKENDINEQIKKLKEEINNKELLNNKYKKWIDKFKQYINIEQLDRIIIVELIEWIKVTKDGEIDVKFKFNNPYE